MARSRERPIFLAVNRVGLKVNQQKTVYDPAGDILNANPTTEDTSIQLAFSVQWSQCNHVIIPGITRPEEGGNSKRDDLL